MINVYDFFVFITACTTYFQFNKCTELNSYYGPTQVLRPVGTIQHCWNILIVTDF